MTVHDRIRDQAAQYSAEMLTVLEAIVSRESPSDGKPGLDALAELLSERLRAVGGEGGTIANPNGGNHVLLGFFRTEAEDRKPGLILGHFDTVWPVGTLARLPFRVQDDLAYGPGILDMKASLVILEFAIRILNDLSLTPSRPWTVLLNSDEEIGSPTSRAIIEAEARESELVLVLEPAAGAGKLKTARKGVGGYTIEAIGRAAHAGLAPEQGINAIVEMARQIPRIDALNRPEAGTTVTVATIQGGTVRNVVPELVKVAVDVRVWTAEEANRVDQGLRSLAPELPGATLKVTGGLNRPPMERTAASTKLFERAQAIGGRLGLDLTETAVGGGSDANFTAALGVPTLDGIGAIGDGAHAETEHIRIASLSERAALLAALLLEEVDG